MSNSETNPSSLNFEWRPVGLQSIVNPILTRRELLSGAFAGTALLTTSRSFANDNSMWWDLDFSLDDKDRSVTITETCRVDPPGDVKACKGKPPYWRLPLRAFGPDAYFDMKKPEDDIALNKATERRLIIRDATFGKRKGCLVVFGFSRRKSDGRWEISFSTDLWPRTRGGSDRVQSACVPFEAFSQASAGSSAQVPHLPSATVDGHRLDTPLDRMFDGLISVEQRSGGKDFQVSIDRDVVWRVQGIGGARLLTHGVAGVDRLWLGWQRASGPDTPAQQAGTTPTVPTGPASPAEEAMHFAAFSDHLSLIEPQPIVLGSPSAPHLRITREACPLARLDIIVGRSPSMPEQEQCVSVLAFGDGILDVRNAGASLLSGLPAEMTCPTSRYQLLS
jgi:hypothetical protein